MKDLSRNIKDIIYFSVSVNAVH